MGTKLNLKDNYGQFVLKDVQLGDRGDVAMLAELDLEYEQQTVEALFVLRPDSEVWEVIAQPGQLFSQPPRPIR
jgi:hypothetical protein